MMFVFEGVMPFINPSKWRRTLSVIEELSDFQLRVGSLIFMIGGILLIYVARSFA